MDVRDPFDPDWEPPPAPTFTAPAEPVAAPPPPPPVGTTPSAPPSGDSKLRSVATGVKLLNGGIAVYLLLVVVNIVTLAVPLDASLALMLSVVFLVGALVAVVLALIGVVKVQTGLGRGAVVQIASVLALFVPLVGLIVMVVVNSGGVRRLKESGYRIASMGLKVEAPATA